MKNETGFSQSCSLWAKTGSDDSLSFHPLLLHLLDVAASAATILEREPATTRLRMASILGLPWEGARPWLLTLIACHDLGKACPGFQCKWSGSAARLSQTGLSLPRSPDTTVNHGFVSQLVLSELLSERQWPEDLADLVSAAVGSHHGSRGSPIALDDLRGNRRALGQGDWTQLRGHLFEEVLSVFEPPLLPTKQSLSGPDFMLLAGLTSFADWIGSNEAWFPFGLPADCEDPTEWYRARLVNAAVALDAIGWEYRSPLGTEYRRFEEVFEFTSRPLQTAVSKALSVLDEPAILLIEAPMGEGKTEAAFFAHLELQRRFGHRGLYIALPSKATGNAMFARTLKFLRHLGMERTLDLQLLHGAALLNAEFQELRLSCIHDPNPGGGIRAGEWFTNKKRALLSEYGVGTVDQAIIPILPVRHNFVRLWGLANRVVVFDEIHAYDAYTGTLLVHLLRWLLELGSSVVLLSATLPPSIRRRLAGVAGAEPLEREEAYPRLTVFQPGRIAQSHFDSDPGRRRTLRIKGVAPDLDVLQAELETALPSEGMGLALLTTVQRAQDLYQLFPEGEVMEREGQRVGKRLSDGTEIFLFHARFPANVRQKREDAVLAVFGERGDRRGRKILIATQVAEQSLDLDFDCMVTDLAPIDLVLQRAGRLWRHERQGRLIPEPLFLIAGLGGNEPPSFDGPLWWGSVYREDILLRTWALLRERNRISLPDEIDQLVRTVYEEENEIPAFLAGRLEKAAAKAFGEASAQAVMANQAIIGLPGDASWDDPARFVLYDEDEPGLHRSLLAQTRLGDENVTAIPLFPVDDFNRATVPSAERAREWYLRAVNLSRVKVVKRLTATGSPEGWKKSPLLRNCMALELDASGKWALDECVRLDGDLGIVYEAKEAG
ncbi:MAG TPA: CRISPR-associated helicase Cas3' [Rectinemataceae bacterium]|nr:CRISPR-associated helicase Cas3' [Rectinemataceae bacterium]